jgi:hypothetical protein
MKTLTAFTVVLTLGIVSALADEPDKANALRGEIEVLQIQQDVDKTLLNEALLLVDRARLKLMAETARTEAAVKNTALEVFIKEKSEAVAKRAAELKGKAFELAALERGTATQKVSRPKPIDDGDRQRQIEELEGAQLEVQLLQMQVQLHQQPLTEALQNVAQADFAAESNPDMREKAETERKRYEKAKAKFIEFSKRFRLEQEKMRRLQESLGGAGMGFGGGFR